jgi:SAM-dependent methyltransferase
MKAIRPEAPLEVPRVYYARPMIDRPLGRYTAEWNGTNGIVRMNTLNRLMDWEGNLPSLYSILRLPYVIKTYFQGRNSYILEKPVPFLVLDAIKRLQQIVTPGMRVLEAGSGNSTLWFLDHGASVTSYDHDETWAQSVQEAAGNNPNLDLSIARGLEAVALMDKLDDQSYDIALVDSTGDIRAHDCIPTIRHKLKPGGWLVLDNSDFPANWRGVALMIDRARERYVGYPPMGLKVCQTSFWQV